MGADRETIERVRATVAEDLAGDATGHDLTHLDRVARLGVALAEHEGADPAVVAVAAYCHDLHRLIERGEGHVRHVASSAVEELVRAALARARVPTAQVEPVVACVAFCGRHGFTGDHDSGSLEACVLRDADNLDAIGAVGIARAFVFGVALGEPMWVPDADAAQHYEPGRTSSVLHHFEEKLLHLRDDMLTRAGRAVADERHAVLERFVTQFRREWPAQDVGPRSSPQRADGDEDGDAADGRRVWPASMCGSLSRPPAVASARLRGAPRGRGASASGASTRPGRPGAP